jgi:hypothetical protein
MSTQSIIGGTEQVYDFYHGQSAVFNYTGHGADVNVLAGSLSVYIGVVTGWKNFPTIDEAYSGPFRSASVGLDLPFNFLGIGISGFASPDWQMKGVAGYLSAGASLVSMPFSASSYQTDYVIDGGFRSFYNDINNPTWNEKFKFSGVILTSGGDNAKIAPYMILFMPGRLWASYEVLSQ